MRGLGLVGGLLAAAIRLLQLRHRLVHCHEDRHLGSRQLNISSRQRLMNASEQKSDNEQNPKHDNRLNNETNNP